MNIDLLPTFLGIAGLEPPADRVIDGIDILPLLTGTGDKRSAGQRPLYFFHEYEVEAVRQGQWKYIASSSHYTWPLPLDKTNTVAGRTARARDYRPADGGPPVPTLGSWPMLYDLGIDREEAYNVAAREPAVTQRLAAQLAAWQREFTAAPRGWKD
jgi:arylsulfatase A-like enzyme